MGSGFRVTATQTIHRLCLSSGICLCNPPWKTSKNSFLPDIRSLTRGDWALLLHLQRGWGRPPHGRLGSFSSSLAHMNKAFIKESDGLEEILCPGCESRGVAVGSATLTQHVLPEFRGSLGDAAWFCRYAGCPVAYYNNWAGKVLVSQLRGPVYPKSPDAPLCSCFPFSMEQIEADAHEPVPRRIRELYAKSQGPEARCALLSPDGQCCLTEIQRLYFRLRGK